MLLYITHLYYRHVCMHVIKAKISYCLYFPIYQYKHMNVYQLEHLLENQVSQVKIPALMLSLGNFSIDLLHFFTGCDWRHSALRLFFHKCMYNPRKCLPSKQSSHLETVLKDQRYCLLLEKKTLIPIFPQFCNRNPVYVVICLEAYLLSSVDFLTRGIEKKIC